MLTYLQRQKSTRGKTPLKKRKPVFFVSQQTPTSPRHLFRTKSIPIGHKRSRRCTRLVASPNDPTSSTVMDSGRCCAIMRGTLGSYAKGPTVDAVEDGSRPRLWIQGW
ncbi:MAG: hypothetical protein Q9214_002213 [Letrouitia sp. 1 TL-2023]